MHFNSHDGNPYFLPLQAAISRCRTEIGTYLLTLVAPTENLGRSLHAGINLLHHSARGGALALAEALVQRGVDLDKRHDAGMTPLESAIRWSRMPVVCFLLEEYRARGRDPQEVLRGLVRRPPLNERRGEPYPLLFLTIEAFPGTIFNPISNEDKRDMMKLLVQEAGANIWDEARMVAPKADDHVGILFLPLHDAAWNVNRPLLEFFLTECKMPVDIPTSDWHLTPLHFLVNNPNRPRRKYFPS